jgi:muconolactone D-isomerase
MEFLVRSYMRWPAGTTADEKKRLKTAEAARRRELMAQGHLRRLWRVPGSPASVSLYEVRDTTQLHEILESLPFWPSFEATVEPLARHPLEDEGTAGTTSS